MYQDGPCAMDVEPEHNAPEPYTQQEQFVARLQPESELEERLVHQIVLCSVKLEHMETLLAKAKEQLHKVLDEARDTPVL
jgi:hypothetical protein